MMPESSALQIEQNEILDLLTSLVDKSLVVFEAQHDADGHYRLLETVREYSHERLKQSEVDLQIKERHAQFYAGIAEAALVHRFKHENEMLDLLEADDDNFRAALDFLEVSDKRGCLALAGALGWYWHLRSHLAEG